MPVQIRAAIVVALMVAFDHASAWQIPGEPLADTPAKQAMPAAEANADAVATSCCVAPAGHLVQLEIIDAVNSATAKRGDRLRLRLAEPIVAGDTVLLPAGIPGWGEVIHAARARGGGKAGELLLAARYLDYAGHQVHLRGMKLGGNGTPHTGAAIAVAIAAGPVGMLVRGGNLEVPAGTLADAKLAQSLDPAALQSASPDHPEPTPTPPVPGGNAGMEDPEPAMEAASDPTTRQE